MNGIDGCHITHDADQPRVSRVRANGRGCSKMALEVAAPERAYCKLTG